MVSSENPAIILLLVWSALLPSQSYKNLTWLLSKCCWFPFPDEEGWETVQRGGRSRSRAQPGKKAGGTPRHMENALKSIPSTDAALGQSHKGKNPAASPRPERKRNNSLDSEKENRPIDQTELASASQEDIVKIPIGGDADINGNENQVVETVQQEKDVDRQMEETVRRDEFSSGDELEKLREEEDDNAEEEELAKVGLTLHLLVV